MPEYTSVPKVESPSLEPKPHVTRHTVNWEISDFSNLTLSRMGSLGEDLKRGCHYINPLYTVSCPQPCLAFFRKAIWARQGWIKLFRQTLTKRGFREATRKLSVTKKQFQVSGVTYLDGNLMDPSVLEDQLKIAENPDLGQLTWSRRKIDPGDFNNSQGQQVLMALSRAGLQRFLSSQSGGACFVTPATTLEAPVLTTTFLMEARRAEDQWHGRLRQQLGAQRRSLSNSIALPARMLIFHGVLIANGQAFRPGHWPEMMTLSEFPKETPNSVQDTVPLADLGLI